MLFVFPPLESGITSGTGFWPGFFQRLRAQIFGTSRADGSGKLIPFMSFLHLANQEGMPPVPVTGGRG